MDTDINNPSLEIRMREIGHQLLLKAGDSTSRVLPVIEKSKYAFTIRFENSLFIEPDTLIKIVRTSMADLHFSESYIVQVESCVSGAVVYGFEIHQQGTKNIVPCVGRSLPGGCYEINVLFHQQQPTAHNMIFLVFTSAVCVGFGILLYKNNKVNDQKDLNAMAIHLGSIRFYPEKQVLKTDKDDIELTAKENHVLKILATRSNEILSRDQLQKEVWEDDGVLVGRSLDVFISRLRKKLEAYPNIRIVNIHGKGYKLEV